MPYILCCILCFILNIVPAKNTVASPNPIDYGMPSDTTPPQRQGVVKVKELPSKQRLKEQRRQQRRTQKNKEQRANKPAPTVVEKKQQQTREEKPVVAPTPISESEKESSKALNAADATEEALPFPVNKKVSEKSTPIPTPPSTVVNNNNKRKTNRSQALSAEEELRLLAQAPATTAEARIPKLSEEQCAFAFEKTDEFTGLEKRGLAPRLFFTYTPEQYRQFIKTADFIRCEGYLSQSSEGGTALNITLVIASPAAKDKFGDLVPSSNMTIRTMEGKEFFLRTYKGGQAVVKGNNTVYEASFVLTKADVKQLSDAEIDQVRLRFTKGFQLYEVYYLDFLREQFPCFK